MLTPFPSATAVALALGARLTLRGLTLRRNPWTFGVRVSHPPVALALGARLTLRGLTLRRNPWTFGVRVSHPHYRYSCQHSHFRYLHGGSRRRFIGLRNAPLPRSEDSNQ